MAATASQSDQYAIRDGVLAAGGAAIQIDNITSITERQSTRPTRGSDQAFFAMIICAVVGAASVYFIPPLGAIAFVSFGVAWYLAWVLRARCWIVIVHESAERMLRLQFNEARDAERFLDALSAASGGRLSNRRSVSPSMRHKRVAYARGKRPFSIAIFFLGGAIIYAAGTNSDRNPLVPNDSQYLGGTIMVLSGIVFVLEWLISAAAVRPKKAPPRDVCASCGYSLIGNVSGVCPECGTKITNA